MAIVKLVSSIEVISILILAALVQTSCGKFFCTTEKFKSDIVKCYQDQGVQADAIFTKFKNSSEYDVTALLAFLLESDGDAACNQSRTSYKNAVRCVYQLNRDCNTVITKSIVANPDDAALMVDPLCDNRKDIDYKCVAKKCKELAECGRQQKKKWKLRENFLISGRCHVTSASALCAKREYKSCGCATSRSYSDVVYDILQPHNCVDQNSTTNRVQCKATNVQEFLSDGLGTGHRLTTSSLLLPPLAILVVIINAYYLS